MMKNKIILVILLIYLLCLPFINGQTLEEYRQLSASEQLETMIEVYGFDKNFARRLQFDQWYDILMEHPEEIKLLLIDSIKTYKALPVKEKDKRFAITHYVLLHDFLIPYGKLTVCERKKVLDIYNKKINEYLATYKLIDNTSVMLSVTIRTLETAIYVPPNLAYAEELYKKYKDLGYEDLSINYDELKNISGLQ